MRVALVTPACHFPSFGAVQQDIYALLKLLNERGHSVTLITLDQPGQSDEILEKISAQYHCPVKKFSAPRQVVTQVLRSIVRPEYFDGSTWAFAQLADSNWWRQTMSAFKPEVVISVGTYSWPVAKWAVENKVAAVTRSHNFEPWHFWEELSAGQKINPFNWLRLAFKYWSEKSATKFGAIAAISPREVGEYQRLNKKATVKLLPLVSLANFSPAALRPAKKTVDIFYMGASYNVPFHRRGAEQLLQKIIPAVNAAAPGKFFWHIAGGKLPARLIALCDNQTSFYEGYVDDLDKFFARMDAGVFPVWSGRGMKQKIFEAIARGFPVVAPAATLGNYPLTNFENALVADTPQEFVPLVLRLADDHTRSNLSAGAARWAADNISKEKMMTYLSALNL